MQIVEDSFIGLRAARHRLESRSCAPKVTLFPMVHLGEAAFYDQVFSEAMAHDVVLVEGVRSQVVRNLTRSYKWVKPETLGLVVQPKLESGNADCKIILADLSGEEFENLWRDIPWWLRAGMAVAAPAAGVYRRFSATRAVLAKGLGMNDLTAREDILAWSFTLAPFLRAVLAQRDTRLCQHLNEVIVENAQNPISVAVVYGAAHMPAVLRNLQEMGSYVPVDSEWLTVFEK